MVRLACGVCLLLLGSPGQQPPNELFEQCMDQAHTAPDRDSKVDHLQAALKARPNHPDNIYVESEIAELLAHHSDDAHAQGTRPLDGLKVYENIIQTYDYDSYYEKYPEPGVFARGQNLIVQAYLQAGGIHQFEQGDPEKAREYSHRAMELLAKTYHQRIEDWLKEPRPEPRPAMPMLMESEEEAAAAYRSQVQRWEERLEAAKQGEVFSNIEEANVRVAVKYYGLSFGRMVPEDVADAMRAILEDFPDTPMAEKAQEHIERASQMLQDRAVETTLGTK